MVSSITGAPQGPVLASLCSDDDHVLHGHQTGVACMLLFARQPYKQKHHVIGQAGPRSRLNVLQETGAANVVERSTRNKLAIKKSYKGQ